MDSSQIEEKLNQLMEEIERQIPTEKIGESVTGAINDALDLARHATDEAARRVNQWEGKRAEKNVVTESEVVDEKIERMRPYGVRPKDMRTSSKEKKTFSEEEQSQSPKNRRMSSRTRYEDFERRRKEKQKKNWFVVPQKEERAEIDKIYYKIPKSGTALALLGGVLTLCNVSVMDAFMGQVMTNGVNFELLYYSENFIGLGVGILLLLLGCLRNEKRGRLKKYLKLFRTRAYCNIADLAQKIGKSEAYVRKDVKKLIDKGNFPQGHLDEKEECLMLNDKLYEEYKNVLEQQRQHQIEEEQLKAQKEAEQEERRQMDEKTRKLYELLEKGESDLKKIQIIQTHLMKEEMREKTARLSHITEQILAQVRKRPENLPEVRRMLDYYLPTTVKILTAYEEFEAQTVQGENIGTAKNEIENSLDTINEAFERLLDNLFDDTAMDISSDISVLHTMLAHEGLAGGNDFEDEL